MKISKTLSFYTGLFIFILFCSLTYIVVVTGVNKNSQLENPYQVTANFNNVGNLKVGAVVKTGGVVIGKVVSISLDAERLTPVVKLEIDGKYRKIPESSSLNINTNGILGDQYLNLMLGFDDGSESYLTAGSVIVMTNDALILEDLLGKFLYK